MVNYFPNNMLYRLLHTITPIYKYYIHDNQGSVRAVVSQSGALVQAADYSAYGVPSTRYKMTMPLSLIAETMINGN